MTATRAGDPKIRKFCIRHLSMTPYIGLRGAVAKQLVLIRLSVTSGKMQSEPYGARPTDRPTSRAAFASTTTQGVLFDPKFEFRGLFCECICTQITLERNILHCDLFNISHGFLLACSSLYTTYYSLSLL